jgi:hypothetical protein
MKNQITAEQFKVTIGRGQTNKSAVAKPYVSKEQSIIRKLDVSSLAISLQRGRELVSC